MNFFGIRADGFIAKNSIQFVGVNIDAVLDAVQPNIAIVKFTNGAEYGTGLITYQDGSKQKFNDPNLFSDLLALHASLVADPPDYILAALARTDRDNLLNVSDWTQMNDTALIASKVTEWATYRQALRDVPQQGSFPGTISWPTEPS